MKKILMVCEAFGGGVFTYVSQLCNDMCHDFEVYLAYATRPQTPDNYQKHLNPEIRLIEVADFGRISNPVGVLTTIRRLRELERTIRPDIIHLHSSIAGGLGRIAFKGIKNTVVYTPHGYAFILMGMGNFKSMIYKWMENALGKTNSITLTCCESEDEVARILCRRTCYIETGLNLQELSDSLKDIEPVRSSQFTVFTLGRVCIQKQPKLFDQIARLVPEARFVWVGDGEKADWLTAPNVELTGWKSRKEALALAKGADAFLLCSLGEAIAMSLLENMFLKKLCLVSNTIGNQSVIKNGVNGYVCEGAQEYAEKIQDAMKQFPADLPQRAYQDVITMYNTETMKKKYIQFYQSIRGGGNSRCNRTLLCFSGRICKIRSVA